jgi:hypothetical protein
MQDLHLTGVLKSLMAELVLRITGDDSKKIRGKFASDVMMQVWSVYDFMIKACDYPEDGNTARVTFGRLTKDGGEYTDELMAMTYYRKLPGNFHAITYLVEIYV